MRVIDDEFFEATSELNTIRAWARARYAAPWAVFGAVLLRVSATTHPGVQLPGLIGGRASLNLLCAFVSASGGGKGISDKVARLAWPAPIPEFPIGSGEGIAEAFRPPTKPDEDNEPLTRAIFMVPEIDTLAGLASRQGSILLATLKSVAMGEQLGQTNASKATSRRVDAHTYRACLSIGAQPGHCGVIFADTTGGTPPRLLWFPTTDPDMPDTPTPDPEPLDIKPPGWKWTSGREGEPSVAEIVYGVDEIRTTVIGAHLARQRGEGDALDGHALLTRCKVAALLAIMHRRRTVTALDWELSAVVMAVSDRTRQWVLDHARQAERAKLRDRAIARAVGDDFYDSSRLETVKRSILRMLERDGEQAAGDIRRRLGKREKRELFDQAIALLEREQMVYSAAGQHNSVRYRIGSPVTSEVTPENSTSEGVTTPVTGDHLKVVPQTETPSSPETPAPRPSARVWFEKYVAAALENGLQRLDPFAVIADGAADGYSEQSVRGAASSHPGITSLRSGQTVVWSLTGERNPTAGEVLTRYFTTLPANSTQVDQTAYYAFADRHGIDRENARKTIVRSGRIDSVPAHGQSKTERIWYMIPATTAAQSSAEPT